MGRLVFLYLLVGAVGPPDFTCLLFSAGQAFIWMTLQEKILYHQIHPLKLAADIGCEAVSLYYFWQRNLTAGVATHLLPPVVASLVLIRYTDLEAYKNSRAGAYLARNMTHTVEGVRLGADLLLVLAAWFHQPRLIILGVVVIVAAWTNGLLRRPSPG